MFAVTFVGIFIAGESPTLLDIPRQQFAANRYISRHLWRGYA